MPDTSAPTGGDLSGTFSRDGKNYTGKYAKSAGYEDAFNHYVNSLGGAHSDSDASRAQIIKELDSTGDQFKTLFKNNVGREATTDEISKFLSENGLQSVEGGARGEGLRNQITQYIGDTFQQAAQDTATQKASDLSGQYSSLADQYLAMGKKSLGNLSDELKGYSTSLFEKLRPQLNLAAQAGGYADSGGQTLQEQGALTDLANQGRGVLADKAYDIENNANNIRYGGMAAPVSMSSQFAANQPYVLANAGANALNFGNQNYMNEQDYQNQLRLAAYKNKLQQDSQPSFGNQLWKELALGSAKGFTGGLGNSLNQFAYGKAKGGGSDSGDTGEYLDYNAV